MKNFREIERHCEAGKYEIEEARKDGKTMAAFHRFALKYASRFPGHDYKKICNYVGVPASYETELRKMIALGRLMAERPIGFGSNQFHREVQEALVEKITNEKQKVSDLETQVSRLESRLTELETKQRMGYSKEILADALCGIGAKGLTGMQINGALEEGFFRQKLVDGKLEIEVIRHKLLECSWEVLAEQYSAQVKAIEKMGGDDDKD
jgi:hypothetical protein